MVAWSNDSKIFITCAFACASDVVDDAAVVDIDATDATVTRFLGTGSETGIGMVLWWVNQ